MILGVSDAVEQIGVPDESEATPTLAALLGTEATTTTKPRRKSASSTSRKRLGKSLKEMNPGK